MSVFDISLETANSLYKWGWQGSIFGAVITALAVAALMLGTRVRDRDFETRMSESNVVAGQARERASAADERAASLEKDAAQLRLDLERERSKTDARILTERQYNILQELRGKVTRVNISWELNTECAFFANQIIQALDAAGIKMRVYFAPAGMLWTGVLVTAPDIPGVAYTDQPLIKTLHKAELWAGGGSSQFIPDAPADIPMIAVGEKYVPYSGKLPFFPPTSKPAQ
jgi:hypothetical protein